MKKTFNTQKIFYLFIFISYIVMNFLFISMVFSKKEKDEIYAGYKSEKIISQIFFAIRNDDLEKILDSYKEIRSFGIYDFTGEAAVQYGKAPMVLPEDDMVFRPELSDFDIRNGVIRIIRPMMPQMMMMRQKRNGKREPDMYPPTNRQPKSIVFVEINIDDMDTQNIGYKVALYFVPIILLLFTGLIIYLYKKNEEFRMQINKHSELSRLGEVSKTLTHEIKNPLAAINIHTGILKKILPVEYRSEISLIENEVARLKLITERIGDFLRDPVGFPEVVDVSSFINEIILRFNYRIEFENPAEKLFIKIDKQRFRSVMENIIKNSIESIEETGNNTPVSINVSSESGHGKDNHKKIVIRVADQGKGFTTTPERLFDPYYTTKTKGSGIGLSIVKRFIDGASGSIIIRNRSNGGVVVTIILPEAVL